MYLGGRAKFANRGDRVLAEATPPHRTPVMNLGVKPDRVLVTLRPAPKHLIELILEVLTDLRERFGLIDLRQGRCLKPSVDQYPYRRLFPHVDDHGRPQQSRSM
jgi:hypothetical protein